MALICGLTSDEKAKALPVTLTGDALSFLNGNYVPGDSFDAIIQKLSDWYTIDQQRQRLLVFWQSLRLSKCMQRIPELSESEVFQILSHDLVHSQRQLSGHYQHEYCLRD